MSSNSPTSRQSGFSLIELLIGMVIAVEILVVALTIFDVHNRMARVQMQITDMQQSLRVAQYDMVRTDAHGRPRRAATSNFRVDRRRHLGALAARSRPRDARQRRRRRRPGRNRYRRARGDRRHRHPDRARLLRGPALPDGPVERRRLLGRRRSPSAGLLPSGRTQSLEELLEPSFSGPLLLQSSVSRGQFAVAEVSAVAGNANSVTFTITFASTLSPPNPLVTAPAADFVPGFVCGLEEYRYYVRETPGDDIVPIKPRLARARMIPGTELPYDEDDANLTLDLADDIFDLQVALGFDTDYDSAGSGVGSFDDDPDFIGPDDFFFEGATDAARGTDDWFGNSSADDPTDAEYRVNGAILARPVAAALRPHHDARPHGAPRPEVQGARLRPGGRRRLHREPRLRRLAGDRLQVDGEPRLSPSHPEHRSRPAQHLEDTMTTIPSPVSTSAPQAPARPGSEAGSAYLATLLVLVVLTILGLSLAVITQTEVLIGGSEKQATRQLFAAGSGVELAAGYELVKRDSAAHDFTLGARQEDVLGTVTQHRRRGLHDALRADPERVCNLCAMNQDTEYAAVQFGVTTTALRRGDAALGARKTVGAVIALEPYQKQLRRLPVRQRRAATRHRDGLTIDTDSTTEVDPCEGALPQDLAMRTGEPTMKTRPDAARTPARLLRSLATATARSPPSASPRPPLRRTTATSCATPSTRALRLLPPRHLGLDELVAASAPRPRSTPASAPSSARPATARCRATATTRPRSSARRRRRSTRCCATSTTSTSASPPTTRTTCGVANKHWLYRVAPASPRSPSRSRRRALPGRGSRGGLRRDLRLRPAATATQRDRLLRRPATDAADTDDVWEMTKVRRLPKLGDRPRRPRSAYYIRDGGQVYRVDLRRPRLGAGPTTRDVPVRIRVDRCTGTPPTTRPTAATPPARRTAGGRRRRHDYDRVGDFVMWDFQVSRTRAAGRLVRRRRTPRSRQHLRRLGAQRRPATDDDRSVDRQRQRLHLKHPDTCHDPAAPDRDATGASTTATSCRSTGSRDNNRRSS